MTEDRIGRIPGMVMHDTLEVVPGGAGAGVFDFVLFGFVRDPVLVEDHPVVAIVALMLMHHPNRVSEFVHQHTDGVERRVHILASTLPPHFRIRVATGLLGEPNVVVLAQSSDEANICLLLEVDDRLVDRIDIRSSGIYLEGGRCCSATDRRRSEKRPSNCSRFKTVSISDCFKKQCSCCDRAAVSYFTLRRLVALTDTPMSPYRRVRAFDFNAERMSALRLTPNPLLRASSFQPSVVSRQASFADFSSALVRRESADGSPDGGIGPEWLEVLALSRATDGGF